MDAAQAANPIAARFTTSLPDNILTVFFYDSTDDIPEDIARGMRLYSSSNVSVNDKPGASHYDLYLPPESAPFPTYSCPIGSEPLTAENECRSPMHSWKSYAQRYPMQQRHRGGPSRDGQHVTRWFLSGNQSATKAMLGFVNINVFDYGNQRVMLCGEHHDRIHVSCTAKPENPYAIESEDPYFLANWILRTAKDSEETFDLFFESMLETWDYSSYFDKPLSSLRNYNRSSSFRLVEHLVREQIGTTQVDRINNIRVHDIDIRATLYPQRQPQWFFFYFPMENPLTKFLHLSSVEERDSVIRDPSVKQRDTWVMIYLWYKYFEDILQHMIDAKEAYESGNFALLDQIADNVVDNDLSKLEFIRLTESPVEEQVRATVRKYFTDRRIPPKRQRSGYIVKSLRKLREQNPTAFYRLMFWFLVGLGLPTGFVVEPSEAKLYAEKASQFAMNVLRFRENPSASTLPIPTEIQQDLDFLIGKENPLFQFGKFTCSALLDLFSLARLLYRFDDKPGREFSSQQCLNSIVVVGDYHQENQSLFFRIFEDVPFSQKYPETHGNAKSQMARLAEYNEANDRWKFYNPHTINARTNEMHEVFPTYALMYYAVWKGLEEIGYLPRSVVEPIITEYVLPCIPDLAMEVIEAFVVKRFKQSTGNNLPDPDEIPVKFIVRFYKVWLEAFNNAAASSSSSSIQTKEDMLGNVYRSLSPRSSRADFVANIEEDEEEMNLFIDDFFRSSSQYVANAPMLRKLFNETVPETIVRELFPDPTTLSQDLRQRVEAYFLAESYLGTSSASDETATRPSKRAARIDAPTTFRTTLSTKLSGVNADAYTTFVKLLLRLIQVNRRTLVLPMCLLWEKEWENNQPIFLRKREAGQWAVAVRSMATRIASDQAFAGHQALLKFLESSN